MPAQLRPRAFRCSTSPAAGSSRYEQLLADFTLDRFLSFKSWIFEKREKDLHNLLYISSLHATIGWGEESYCHGTTYSFIGYYYNYQPRGRAVFH